MALTTKFLAGGFPGPPSSRSPLNFTIELEISETRVLDDGTHENVPHLYSTQSHVVLPRIE